MICYALILQFSSVSNTPFVFLTVIHTSPPQNKHDATSVWAEDVNNYDFKACVRELKNFDGVHRGVKLVSEFDYCDGSEEKSDKALSSPLTPTLLNPRYEVHTISSNHQAPYPGWGYSYFSLFTT